MQREIRRVAFVSEVEEARTRQIAAGLSTYAKPANGLVTREFYLGPTPRQPVVPAAFQTWDPDAVVCFLGAYLKEQIQLLAAGGRPVVNVSRDLPDVRKAVVLADFDEVFEVVHQHFYDIDRPQYGLFCMEPRREAEATVQRFSRFAGRHGVVPVVQYQEQDPPHLFDLEQITDVSGPHEETANWLLSLPRPFGIFALNITVGPYLCRLCELLGLNVPGDIAVIGCDGFDRSTACSPSLTSLHFPSTRIGYEAGRTIAAMLDGEQTPSRAREIGGTQLLVRDSTQRRNLRGCDIDLALEFIANHACDGIRVNDVFEQTQAVSRMTFHKRFSQVTGMTPLDAIHQARFREAKRLLTETQFSIGTIASMCGFADDLYFSQSFRKQEGVPPRTYRRVNAETV